MNNPFHSLASFRINQQTLFYKFVTIVNYSCQMHLARHFKKQLLRTVPTISKVFLHGFMNMRKKQISTSVIKIQKENWG